MGAAACGVELVAADAGTAPAASTAALSAVAAMNPGMRRLPATFVVARERRDSMIADSPFLDSCCIASGPLQERPRDPFIPPRSHSRRMRHAACHRPLAAQ